jgi:RNA polymerase sigma-70 factor (ECF subfamily)
MADELVPAAASLPATAQPSGDGSSADPTVPNRPTSNGIGAKCVGGNASANGTAGVSAGAWSATIEAVYRSQAREIWALFYAHCSDPERAQDALQEAFARLHEQDGRTIRDVRAWLLRVGRNWLRDVARREKVRARAVDFLDATPAPGDDPLAAVSTEEQRTVVRAALGRLRAEDREVLVLRYAMNWPSQRIAETLDITPAAVDMRLSRARKRLGALLEQSGVRPE